MAKYNKTHKTA